jgi:hypothetical protein
MAATKHKLIQGASYALDFTTVKYPTLDVNWTGTWAIVDVLGSGGTTEATGAMAPSADLKAMELRIAPTDTASITEGSYILVAQITNTTLGYSDEVIQDPLTITAQGII